MEVECFSGGAFSIREGAAEIFWGGELLFGFFRRGSLERHSRGASWGWKGKRYFERAFHASLREVERRRFFMAV